MFACPETGPKPGVHFVTVTGRRAWDTHGEEISGSLKTTRLGPRLEDPGLFGRFLQDLYDRGLLEADARRLVLAIFRAHAQGLTRPQDRDQWGVGPASACMGGGGLRTGEVVGENEPPGRSRASIRR